MAYIKNTWVDQNVERPRTYELQNNTDGSVTFIDSFGNVTELGTPVNADNMNHIEEGIYAGSFTKYDANGVYEMNDLVTVIEDGSPVIYKSLQDDNKGNTLSDTTYWEKISLGGGGGGLEIGDIGFTQMAIDETKGKRRVLNGQLIIQDQYVQFTNIIKNSVALNPDLACTESEWQTEVIMNTFGLCGKFVIDDEAGTIRLPKYPNYFIAGLANIAPVVGNGNGVGLYAGKYGVSGLAYVAPTSGASILAARLNLNGTPAGTKTTSSTTWSGTVSEGTSFSVGVSTDPTKSGIEAQIKQEKIAGTYFIQVATGAETEDNIINEIELNNPFFYGMSQYFESEPNNISWLKSAGQWNAKAVYTDYYDWLLKIYNGVEVVEGVSVKLSTEEYTDYDYVLNTAEETFRLPLLDGSESLPSDRYEDLTLLSSGSTYTAPANGWVNIAYKGQNSDTYVELSCDKIESSGYENTTNYGTQTVYAKRGDIFRLIYRNLGLREFRFIYAQGNGSLYYYVGETVQNANLINAGRIEEKLADLIPDNSSLIASYAMPSSRYIDLTLGASGTTYTAPANGWFCINKASTAGTQRVTLLNENSSIQVTQNSSVANQTLACYVPIKKGETCKVVYDTGGTLAFFRFVYAEGDR